MFNNCTSIKKPTRLYMYGDANFHHESDLDVVHQDASVLILCFVSVIYIHARSRACVCVCVIKE